MKWILTLLIFSVCSQNSFASSPQVPDYLIYKKDTIPTYNLLVEHYLQKTQDDKGRLFDLSFRNSIDGTLGSSLNCWRGYQAIYKIENDSLFVTELINCHSLKDKTPNPNNYLRELFGDKVKNNKVFIDWFSGNISFPSKRNNNTELRWDGVFERIFLYETILTIGTGKVIQTKDEQNYIDLKNGIERLKQYSTRNTIFDRIKNYKWTKLDKFDCSELYSITIGKDGKVTDVTMTEYQKKESIKEYWDTKREYNHCIKSIQKSLSNLQFDIVKRKGEPIEEKVSIEMWFNKDGTIEKLD
ncbi:hypothetical protein [Cellulophaga tyrosinoxydans]|uniref:MORN repeat variant n=1 Tax=Cellulophaga tyrosinoxydans TaxID=504486 RepID=A0A1W2CM28_9FLAO|nr:hypothetical protein [Cellulophaga tyrosinoxydans]SMC86307.1 hypothetical protein SAMN05660703_3074 [Cellulophaga tyrosinoxydans]